MESIGKVVLISKGDYNASTTYTHLDWVRYNGKSWVCKQDNTVGVTPAEGQYWTLMAQDGADGQDGQNGQGVPTGGTTGQILAKKSNTDYDTEWVNGGGGGGSNDEQLIRDTVGWTGKNLLENTATTQTTHDITFTVNSDGSVSTSGTRDEAGVTQFKIGTITDFSVGDSLTLSGCPSGGADDTFNILALSKNSGGTATKYSRDKGSGITFEVVSNTAYIDVYIEAYYGTSMNDKVFRPMLRRASVTDSTYEPYHLPVTDYTHEAVADGIGWGNKNKIPLTFTNIKASTSGGTWSGNVLTKDGATFTFNTDSEDNITSIVATAGNSAQSINLNFTLPVGSYKLSSGFAETNGNNDSFLQKNGTTIARGNSASPAQAFTLTEESALVWYLRITSGSYTAYPMIHCADIVDATYKPYHPTVKQTLRDAEVIEGKNLLHIPESVVSQTINGVTFTVNRNSVGEVVSIKVNGTNDGTAASNFTIANSGLGNVSFSSNNTYKLSGCPANGGNNSYHIAVADASGQWTNSQYDKGSGSDITLGISALLIVVAINQTVSNLMFYPMVRYATETDATYEPYYTPLKDGKFDREEQRVLGAKNLLQNKATTQTVNGITFTVNADGSVTVNGTASARASLIFVAASDNIQLQRGKFILSKSAGQVGVSLILDAYNGSSWVKTIATSASENEVIADIDYVGYDRVAYYLTVESGTTINNVRVYPMLRLASDPDDTYVPYAMTNKELTDGLANVGSPAWSAITSKPFNDVNTSTGGLTITSGSLNANVKSVSVGTTGTAGSTTVKKQQVTINGSATDLIGAAYMSQTVTLLSSQETSVTFTNAIITATSLIDIFISEPISYKTATTTNGTCTITYSQQSSDTSVTITIRIINI